MRDDGVEKLLKLVSEQAPDSLRARGIYCRVSHDKTRVTLSYEQLEADPLDSVASACRGLVVSGADIDASAPIAGARVAARPFARFFNAGQQGAVDIDPDRAVVQLKYDGTLIIFYCFMGTWRVGTRSTPDADVPRHDGSTYAQSFWRLWGDRRFDELDETKTYLFELVGPKNRHVVAHADDELVLLGVISTASGEEDDPRPAAQALGFKHAFTGVSLSTVQALAATLDGVAATESEGFVVVDMTTQPFRRVKVKNPLFAAANGAQQLLDRSPRTALVTVLGESIDDVLASSVLPEHVQRAVCDLRDRVAAWCAAAELDIAQLRTVSDRRDLAREVARVADPTIRAGAFHIIDSGQTVAAWVRARAASPCVSKRFLNVLLEGVGGYHL